jgi:hypothetical protein
LCGNGIVDEEEACDGDDFGVLSCGSFGLREPNSAVTALACTDACQINTDDCNGTIAPVNGLNIANRLQAAVNNELNQVIRLSPPQKEQGGLEFDFYDWSEDENITADDLLSTAIVGPVQLNESNVGDYTFDQTTYVYAYGTGYIRVPGDVNVPDMQLRVLSDDGIRVLLDSNDDGEFESAIDAFYPQGPTNHDSATLSLQGGSYLPVTLEFFQQGGGLTLELSWKAPSLGVDDWQIIPAEYLYHGEDADWNLNSSININRTNGLVIESDNPDQPAVLRAPNNGPAFSISDDELQGDVVLRDFTIENVREGIEISSAGDNENFVIIDGLSIEGIYNGNNNNNLLSYGILAEQGRSNVIIVNNTIKAPSANNQQTSEGIYVYGNCAFIGFNHLEGNFGPAILLNVDNTTNAGCGFKPSVDNNSIHLNVGGFQDAIWLSGTNVLARNNLIYKGEFDTGFALRNMLLTTNNNPLQNNYIGINQDYCVGPCVLNNVCEIYDACGTNNSGCCSNFCDVNDTTSGCISAFPGLDSMNDIGCAGGDNSFTWIDKGVNIDYPEMIDNVIPAISGSDRDIGARESGVAFTVGGEARVCAE